MEQQKKLIEVMRKNGVQVGTEMFVDNVTLQPYENKGNMCPRRDVGDM